jgi:hypothetical protein
MRQALLCVRHNAIARVRHNAIACVRRNAIACVRRNAIACCGDTALTELRHPNLQRATSRAGAKPTWVVQAKPQRPTPNMV